MACWAVIHRVGGRAQAMRVCSRTDIKTKSKTMHSMRLWGVTGMHAHAEGERQKKRLRDRHLDGEW